jgi:hypothetical protein
MRNASQEVRQLCRRYGVSYQKVSGARMVAENMDPERNLSKSFQVFLQGVQRLIEEGAVVSR